VTIDKPGTVVSGLEITGGVTINASNVTLKNCRIHGTDTAAISVRYSDVSGVIIDHVEIDGGKRSPSVIGIKGSGYTVQASNIHGTGDAVDAGDNVVVKDSYIHDLWVAPGDHTDGVQTAGGVNLLVTHSTINAIGVNAALMLGADLSAMNNTVATNNLLDGGNYTVFAGTDGKYSSGLIKITNNRFGMHARYGPYSFNPSSGLPIVFTGNTYDATGEPLA
jgi:hypothetical protein